MPTSMLNVQILKLLLSFSKKKIIILFINSKVDAFKSLTHAFHNLERLLSIQTEDKDIVYYLMHSFYVTLHFSIKLLSNIIDNSYKPNIYFFPHMKVNFILK